LVCRYLDVFATKFCYPVAGLFTQLHGEIIQLEWGLAKFAKTGRVRLILPQSVEDLNEVVVRTISHSGFQTFQRGFPGISRA